MSIADTSGQPQTTPPPARETSPPSGEARLRLFPPTPAVGWRAAIGATVVAAGALRLIGIKHGLPYVYNADENAHFVPRAIGMFGHSLNPDYFINPPAFTYLIHLVYAIKWGTDPATIGDAFAKDPTTAFTLARIASATLGAAAAGLLAIAGARLVDKKTGLVAGALLAVAFLPVSYGHLALNDGPTLAPVAAALIGIAGIYKTGRLREYALAGAALGIAIATKYTAGILLIAVIAAAILAPKHRLTGLALATTLTVAGFLIANPYALLDHSAFQDGLQKQTETAGEDGGKLGLEHTSGWRYYATTITWGLGWLPALAALGGAAAALARHRRLAAILLPAPILLFAYLGHQERFFARWMLPVYPLLCLLAAWAAVRAASWLAAKRSWKPAWPAVAAGALLCAQGLLFSIHNDVVLARPDTRQLARDWMVANIPAGSKVVIEPIAPDQWAADVGHPNPATGSGNRWNKWRTSRSRVANDGTLIRGAARVVKLEDYERTTRPQLVGSYRRGGFCWVVTGSTQFGRAYADPDQVPQAIRYYDALKRDATVAHRETPYDAAGKGVPFSFDFSFNYYPLSYHRPGPEIVIYRLKDCA